MKLTREWFNKKCITLKMHEKIYIGYSGGADSGVLLHLCINYVDKKENLRVIHINHSTNKNSKKWDIFCTNVCNNLRIPIHTYTLNSFIQQHKSEATFRTFRFKSFSDNTYKNSTLLLAHNKNDFTETVLLKLFRGSGVFGMSGIREKIKIKNLNIIRPLLLLDKTIILKYAEKNKLLYIIDFSNFNNKFNRNFIRNEILSLITKSWIGVNKSLITFSAVSNGFYTYIHSKCKFFFESKGFDLKFISIKYLLIVPKILRYEILRLWIRENNYKTPSFLHLNEINKILMSDRKKTPYIKVDTYLIKKFNKNIYIENINKNEYIQKSFFSYKNKKKMNYSSLNIICRKQHFFLKENNNFTLENKITYKNNKIIISGSWISVKYIFFAQHMFLVKSLE